MLLPESTLNLLLSGLMGIFGGLITIPFNTYFARKLRREEQILQHKLDRIARTRELILQHELEMARAGRDSEVAELKAAVGRIEERLKNA